MGRWGLAGLILLVAQTAAAQPITSMQESLKKDQNPYACVVYHTPVEMGWGDGPQPLPIISRLVDALNGFDSQANMYTYDSHRKPGFFFSWRSAKSGSDCGALRCPERWTQTRSNLCQKRSP